MLRIFLLYGLFLGWCVHLTAQTEVPDQLFEVIELEKEYCKPGVVNKSRSKGLLIQYNLYPNYKITSDESQGNLANSKVKFRDLWRVKLKIPLMNRCDLKLLLGWDHYREGYNFSFLNNLDFPLQSLEAAPLVNNRFNIYLVKALNKKYYLGGTLSASFNGNYQSFFEFQNRYAVYRGAVTFGVKKTEELEWGIGLFGKKGFRSSYVLPFGFYNQSFSEKWGIETIILSSVFGRYNFSERTIFLFGAEYKSEDFSLDVLTNGSNSIFNYKRPGIQFLLRMEQQLTNLFWLDVRAGYIFNINPIFEGTGNQNDFLINDISNGLGMSIGIFLSPPKHWIK